MGLGVGPFDWVGGCRRSNIGIGAVMGWWTNMTRATSHSGAQ